MLFPPVPVTAWGFRVANVALPDSKGASVLHDLAVFVLVRTPDDT